MKARVDPYRSVTASESDEFQQIIILNECVKAIEMLSRKVDLDAINARLSARNAGDRGKGFAVVAHELHQFSNQLNEAKQRQAQYSRKLVVYASQQATLTMRHQSIARLADYQVDSRYTEQAAADCEQQIREVSIQMKDNQRNLDRLITQMKRQCRVGETIIKSALIEAAHCGQAGAGLKTVAEAMGQVIARIAEQLDAVVQQRKKGVP